MCVCVCVWVGGCLCVCVCVCVCVYLCINVNDMYAWLSSMGDMWKNTFSGGASSTKKEDAYESVAI